MNRITIPLLFIILISCEPKNKALEPKDDPQLSKLKVPEGFKITFFAKDVDNARSMALGENGTVFVGNRKKKMFTHWLMPIRMALQKKVHDRRKHEHSQWSCIS